MNFTKLIGKKDKFYAHPMPSLHPESKRYFLSIIDGRKVRPVIFSSVWHDKCSGCYTRTKQVVELLNAALEIK